MVPMEALVELAWNDPTARGDILIQVFIGNKAII